MFRSSTRTSQLNALRRSCEAGTQVGLLVRALVDDVSVLVYIALEPRNDRADSVLLDADNHLTKLRCLQKRSCVNLDLLM